MQNNKCSPFALDKCAQKCSADQRLNWPSRFIALAGEEVVMSMDELSSC